MTTTIRLQREAFDIAAETAAMTRGRTDIGAVVTFTGICRADENGAPIAALTLEHYPGMAETEIARHIEEARARWPLLGVTVVHRYGRIEPGEVIVLVRDGCRAIARRPLRRLRSSWTTLKRAPRSGSRSPTGRLGRGQDGRQYGCRRWAPPPARREAAK